MKKRGMITTVILCIIIVGLVGFIVWDKVINNKKDNEKTNTTNVIQNNAVTNSDETTTNNNSSTSNNTSTKSNATTPSKLIVSREGMEEEVTSKEYSSIYGYTIRYATDSFKASNHDDQDWFERDEDINCVVVKKEDISYSKKISSLSNYKETTVNGYESVYTTRKVEGQAETTYYINSGKDCVYEITTSCQDTTEYLEGLGHIMDAMVHTFAIK